VQFAEVRAGSFFLALAVALRSGTYAAPWANAAARALRPQSTPALARFEPEFRRESSATGVLPIRVKYAGSMTGAVRLLQ
jgi:hypothetical protein